VLATLVDEDGALLHVVELSEDGGSSYALARQLMNGQPDETFGAGGTRALELPPDAWLTVSADLRADGKLWTLGSRSIPGSDFPHAMLGRLQPTATFASVPEQVPFLSGLTLFPNPVADRFTLAFQHEGDGPLRIELMDLQGRLVHRFAERLFPQGEQRLELAWPGDAAQGAYVLSIVGAEGRAALPVVR